MEKIEQALKGQKKRELFQRLKESKVGIVIVFLVVVVLSWNVYCSTDKVNEQNNQSGVLVGMHQVQGNLGSTTTKLSIRLENGETILVTAPEKFVMRSGAGVEVIRDKTEQGAVYYHFGGYRETK